MSIMGGATVVARDASGSTTTSSGRATSEGAVREVEPGAGDDAPVRCTASGWRLRVACTDGRGGAICPACGRQVGADPDAVAGPGVWMIQEHAR